MMEILHTLDELRHWRQFSGSAGLVPTMGALHRGHVSLIETAARHDDRVIVSIFVNPTQFNDPADLLRYPRDFERDVAIARDAGVHAIYAPQVATIYPAGFSTSVSVSGITEDFEGESRPGHFDGVATVVTILLNQVRPDHAFFGEKDFQQLAMIRRMQRDLALPGEIVACPTVRDDDGLALSSRNVRLSPAARTAALVLSRTLFAMRDQTGQSRDNMFRLVTMGAVLVRTEPLVNLEYLQVVDPETLLPVETLVPGARALIAATVDGVRLIDNLELAPR
jgi:pantoate--beta-alanine ligase